MVVGISNERWKKTGSDYLLAKTIEYGGQSLALNFTDVSWYYFYLFFLEKENMNVLTS